MKMVALILLCLCSIIVAIVLMNLEPPARRGSAHIEPPPDSTPAAAEEAAQNAAPPASGETEPNAADTPSAPTQTTPSGPAYSPGPLPEAGDVNEADLAYLRTKHLLIPVAGVPAAKLRDSFYESRSEGRSHQALDIMAAEGAPVLACADGTVKLYTSIRGGTMIYETDSSGNYVYSYGHLQKYGDGLYDGKSVKRGEVIAYVGDTGNAGPGNFHLHFGISKVSAPGKWSGGTPINPYPLLTGK